MLFGASKAFLLPLSPHLCSLPTTLSMLHVLCFNVGSGCIYWRLEFRIAIVRGKLFRLSTSGNGFGKDCQGNSKHACPMARFVWNVAKGQN